MSPDETGANSQPAGASPASSGAEPVYGPAYTGQQPGVNNSDAAYARGRNPLVDGPSPPYTAPYPPYPSEVPYQTGISPNVASGLAYFTVIPAVLFLLLEPYRKQPQIRFHCWQSIFYFLAAAGIRVLEMTLATLLPSLLGFLLGSLISLLLFAGWLIVVIKAFQGSRYLLPVIGPFAEQTARSTSGR